MNRDGQAYETTAIQHRESLWSAHAQSVGFPPLEGDLEVDVAIVGGGITGLTAARQLASAGRQVAVLEAYRVGAGSTGFSTGNLYSPVGSRLHVLGRKHGADILREVVQARERALNHVEDMVRGEDIDCDFLRVPFHLFSTDEEASDLEQVGKEIDAATQAGLSVETRPPAGFPWQPSRLLSVPAQAHFNPLRYVQGLATACEASAHCRIFEGCRVLKASDGDPCELLTESGTVRAGKVIMATHSPKGVYGVHAAMEPYREYGLAVRLSGALPPDGSYWHLLGGKQYSVRTYRRAEKDFLVVVGEPHKVGEKSHNEESFSRLEDYLRRYYPVAEVVNRWSAMSFKSADNLPYIGVTPMEENTLVATGFATDGLTYGSLAGLILADDILGRDNAWARLFSPRRFTPGASAKNFGKENLSVTRHLLKDYLSYGEVRELKEIPPGEGRTLKVDGERVAAYRDDAGQLKVVSAVCTHMGCLVHWNSAQKSWDCPCHGSRFSLDGEVLEGPALSNLARPKPK